MSVQSSDAVDNASIKLLNSRKYIYLPSTPYYKYTGLITIKNTGDEYTFGYQYDGKTYQIDISAKCYSEYLSLFRNGILHPQYFVSRQPKIGISQLEEYTDTRTPNNRNYKCWVWQENLLNPCEYGFELLNKNATNETPTAEFVENAKLIYISSCSVII